MNWEFGIGRCKLVYIDWINNRSYCMAQGIMLIQYSKSTIIHFLKIIKLFSFFPDYTTESQRSEDCYCLSHLGSLICQYFWNRYKRSIWVSFNTHEECFLTSPYLVFFSFFLILGFHSFIYFPLGFLLNDVYTLFPLRAEHFHKIILA